jgi:hypothetical protein
MPMGIEPDEFGKMEIGALRQLLEIAEAMVGQTTMPSLQSEYQEVVTLAKSEIRRREVIGAATTLQTALRAKKEREKNEEEDTARLVAAQKRLTELGIDISVDPKLVSHARLYHLATLIEALDLITQKNPWLGKKAPGSVKKSQLPGRGLQAQYDTAKKDVDTAIAAIQKVYDDRKKEIELAARLAKTVAIPAEFKQEGALKDYGTFLYPFGGSIVVGKAKSYSLHPNRTLVHVKDELPDGATPTLAGQYLAALVRGCLQFLNIKGWSDGERHRVDGTLPSGRTFFWMMIGKPKASLPGYSGEIFHIDSGYQNSRWRFE